MRMGETESKERDKIACMRNCIWICTALLLIPLCSTSMAVESGMYRLLSVSRSEKLIVVSQIPSKTRYILDAASAKITIDGESAEFRELKSYSLIQLKLELEKSARKGVDIDGRVIEIRISSEGTSSAQPAYP
jgi:hypothetical protein